MYTIAVKRGKTLTTFQSIKEAMIYNRANLGSMLMKMTDNGWAPLL
jgi:hypothetical protein